MQEWLDSVGEGIPRYVTPKGAVGAVVGNDAGEVLLVQRSDSGIWLYPTGWADVGYSAAEVVVKEVFEETGIECEPVQVLSVVDGQRMGFTRFFASVSRNRISAICPPPCRKLARIRSFSST